MSETFTAAALCAVGAEKVVANELRKLGLEVMAGGYGRVRFGAALDGLYRALMSLRAADRVLLELARFPARDFDALFEGVRRVPWEDYVPRGMGLLVSKVRSSASVLSAERSIQSVAHKAAAERLCRKFRVNRLPEDGLRAELRVYIDKNMVSALLDISGDPLFKRGYRGGGGGTAAGGAASGGTAPLRETTAAAILLLSGWRRKFPLRDPFCGAGTIAIEAALYAWDVAPGLGRDFALSNLVISSKGMEMAVREELRARADFSRAVRIQGSDSGGASIALAQANAARALAAAGKKAPPLPVFRVQAMEDAAPGPDEKEGFIVTNPPYGRRLGSPAGAEALYGGMGEGLGARFPGWRLGVITDHPGFESFFARKADSCREITNGALRTYFYQYERL